MNGFAWASGSSTQAATTTLFGRSLGERKSRKARSYLRLALKCTFFFAVVEMFIFIVFGRPLAAAFSNDSALYPTITGLLIVSAFSLPFINVHQTVSGALRSAGDSVAPLIASFVSLWLFRVVLGYILIFVFDMGIYSQRLCLVLDQFVRCLIVSVFYLTGHWKKYLLRPRKN
jgi:Na+-driven multidrug efflux pump